MIGYVENKASNEPNPEIMEARKQKTNEQMRADLEAMLEKTPARQYARYAYKPELSKEYEELKNTDTSNFTNRELEDHSMRLFNFKHNGGIDPAWIQNEIEESLNTSLSKSFEIVEALEKEILDLEEKMENFPVDEYNYYATEIGNKYKERAKGANPMYRAVLEQQLDAELDKLKLQYYTKPRNELAKERHEKLTKYRIWDSAIKLFCAENKQAIAKAQEQAKAEEINANLLKISEYMEKR